MSPTEPSIGYAPHSATLTAPGDRRRFCAYAAERGFPFEIADPRKDYDVVVITLAADLVTWSRYQPGRAKIVFDLIDSYLAGPGGPTDMMRGIAKFMIGDITAPTTSYRRLLIEMCRRAEAVVCTTLEQRELVAPYCPNVHVILDIQDEDVRCVKTQYAVGETLNLFWEGLPYTLPDFRGLRDVLRAMGNERPIAMHLMTDLTVGRLGGRVARRQTRAIVDRLFDRAYIYEWNGELLSAVACACDLAVIPLNLHHALARGKPENKLLLMWRMALPVITSATPAYVRAMRAAGVDGACATSAQWTDALRYLAADEVRRREAGQRGRKYADREYSSARMVALWDEAFASLGVSF